MSNATTSPSIRAIARSAEVPASDVHRAFASDRRQVVLEELTRRTTPVDASALARAVATREADSEPADLPPERIQAVQVTLYHVHLPKLDDLGLVDYDDGGVVTDYVDAIEASTE